MHTNMDVNRRKQSLQSYAVMVSQETEREQKAFEGVEKLMDVYRTRPSFADVDTRSEVDQRLNHVRTSRV